MALRKLFLVLIIFIALVGVSTVIIYYVNNAVPKKSPVRARQVYIHYQIPKYYLVDKKHNLLQGAVKYKYCNNKYFYIKEAVICGCKSSGTCGFISS